MPSALSLLRGDRQGGRVKTYVRAGSAAAGVAAALGLLELGLRAFVSPEWVPAPRIHADSLFAPAVARRQMEEGIALAHYSVAGARLTSNPPADSGLVAVLLGDSFVQAREVADHQTMGAQLERSARARGMPLDVRQYGWLAASPAQYLRVADDVRARWRPWRVLIVLSESDLNEQAFVGEFPRLRVDPRGDIRLVGAAMDTTPPRDYSSALWRVTHHRWLKLRRRGAVWASFRIRNRATVPAISALPDSAPPADSAEVARLPDAAVRSLGRAYGAGLTLIYLANVGLTGGEQPTAIESRFLASCRDARVNCASTRDAALEARRNGRVAHGVSTYPIGSGHLNPHGHAVVASVMWQQIGATSISTESPPAAGRP